MTKDTTRDEARLFARRQHRVEVAVVLSNPFARPVGWALLLGALPFTVVLTPLTAAGLPPLAATAATYAMGLVILVGTWHLTAPIIEARSFHRAPYHWFLDLGNGAGAGAFARRDGSGRLTICSVWADPRSHGHGTTLLRKIISDTAPTELWLVADNRQVANFYRRCGFIDAGRVLTGHRMVLHRDGCTPAEKSW